MVGQGMSTLGLEISDIPTIVVDESRSVPEICECLCQDITTGKFNVLELIEGLESLLTDTDEFKRQRGTAILAEVLQRLPRDLLSKEVLSFILSFFCARIEDHFIVTPSVLQGFLALADMKNIADDTPMKILKCLSNNVTCQALQVSQRYTYYCIIDALLHNKTKELLKTPGEFVQMIIAVIDSENDPRNLIKLFSILPYFLRTFPLQSFAEDMFSVLECYFPIDYNPRESTDTTRHDLAKGLEECLTSTSEFGPFCIPMLLEKLESVLKVAHVDALNLLIRGCNVWSIDHINKDLKAIWTAVRSLLVPGNDSEVSELVVTALTTLIRKYSTSPLDTNQADALNQLLNDITASTHDFLKDAGLSFFAFAVGILGSIANASSQACCHIVVVVVSQLLALLRVPTDHHETVLSALRPILSATVKYSVWETKDEKLVSILSKVPTVLIEILENPVANSGSYLCLADIVPVLPLPEREILYSMILLKMPKEHSEKVRDACAEFVKSVGVLHPEELKSNVFSLIPSRIDGLHPDETKHIIDMFCWACHVRPLTTYAMGRIIEYLTSCSNATVIAVQCLRSLCESLRDDNIIACLVMENNLPEVLFSHWLTLSRDGKLHFCCDETLCDVSRIIEALVKPLNTSDQHKVMEKCISSFASTNGESLWPTNSLSGIEVVLLEGLLGSLKPDIMIQDCDKLAINLLHLSVNESSSEARKSASRLLASIINKHKDDSELERILEESILVICSNLDSSKAIEATQLLCWICKGLILRAHPQMNTWIEKLLDLLKKENVQMEAAQGFQLILTDSDRFLNINSYCNIRILYKQRLFSTIDKMIDLFENTEGSTKSAVSMAIAYLLISSPRQLLLDKLVQLIKVMTSCLDGEDLLVRATILDLLGSLLADKEPVLVDYTDTFIPRCIHNACARKMEVRMNALNCIYHYGKYDLVRLLPYKNLVLNGLVKCLDDKKRLVRQKAVKARNKWFLFEFSTTKE